MSRSRWQRDSVTVGGVRLHLGPLCSPVKPPLCDGVVSGQPPNSFEPFSHLSFCYQLPQQNPCLLGCQRGAAESLSGPPGEETTHVTPAIDKREPRGVFVAAKAPKKLKRWSGWPRQPCSSRPSGPWPKPALAWSDTVEPWLSWAKPPARGTLGVLAPPAR